MRILYAGDQYLSRGRAQTHTHTHTHSRLPRGPEMRAKRKAIKGIASILKRRCVAHLFSDVTVYYNATHSGFDSNCLARSDNADIARTHPYAAHAHASHARATSRRYAVRI